MTPSRYETLDRFNPLTCAQATLDGKAEMCVVSAGTVVTAFLTAVRRLMCLCVSSRVSPLLVCSRARAAMYYGCGWR
jgi:hypothetical protein